MDEWIYASAISLADAIRSKEVSSEEVVRAYLRRIEAIHPQINAVVQLAAERVCQQARAADAALARGEIRGPLHGVPFTAKDVFDSAGIVTAVGLEARAGFVPSQDATVIARMLASGALLLGKTNCPPGGGGGITENPIYGRTNNPYDLDRSPGGSSGGEAALIAAGGSPLGIGSDSGGSIRLPAHFCGIAGLKPTTGRVPNTGAYDHPGGLSDLRTQVGPLSRYAQDLGPMLAIIAGMDWHDSGVVPMPLGDAGSIKVEGLSLAFYTRDGMAPPTPETVAAVRKTARVLADVGLLVEEEYPCAINESRDITERYWRMAELSGAQVEGLMRDWDRFRTSMLSFMEKYDVVLSPVDRGTAPLHETKDPLMFNFTLPYSLTGYPCVVVRAGTSLEGLPIGVQVVARPWREDVALAVAQQIETALGGWQRPPL